MRYTARFLKDNPSIRKALIAELAAALEEGPGPGGGGVFPKSHKPLCISNPELWENGYLARHVDGKTIYARPFYRAVFEHPSMTREYYEKQREKYLLNE